MKFYHANELVEPEYLVPEEAEYFQHMESASNAGHLCFDQSSISDSVG